MAKSKKQNVISWPAISDFVSEIKSGKRSAVETIKLCLAQIEATKDYHAILEVNPEALRQAEAIDERIKKGDKSGRLLGVPYVAKDVFLTKHTHTTASSNILKPFRAPFQSTAVEKLQAEGAIMLGKANHDAFGHGTSTENSDFGPTKNPYNSKYVPGGSSGGSAAAVALGQAVFSLAEDTGGSIRLPASFCGVVGLKPTYGLISRYGVIAMASSADTVGTITCSVADSAYLLDILAGTDRLDSTTIERESDYTNLNSNLKKLKVGFVKQHLESVDLEISKPIKAVLTSLEKAGAVITEISIPVDDLALAAYYIIVPAEISSNLARYDGIKYGFSDESAKDLAETYTLSRAKGFGAEAKRRIMIGTYVLSSGYYDAYYKQAQAVRTLLINQYAAAFKQVDILVGPVAPTPPFKLGAKPDPLSMYLTDIFTVQPNLLGIPALSLPIGESSEGLPIGLHMTAPQRQEKVLLNAAKGLEALLGGIMTPSVLLIVGIAALFILAAPMIVKFAAKGGVNRKMVWNQWHKIQTEFESGRIAPKYAVIEADKLLDYVLKGKKYKGSSMADRMRAAQNQFKNRNAVWQAHKLRNQAVHEAGFEISVTVAKQALDSFRQALKDVGVL